MSSTIVDIIILAAIAAFIILRLRNVLGRRTGNERPRQPPFGHRDSTDTTDSHGRDGNVVPLPGAPTANGQSAPESQEALKKIAQNDPTLVQSLTQVQLADRQFEPEGFLAGAKAAYEMVVTAFAAGDRKGLRPLLSDEVYDSFESVIRRREDKGLKTESKFIGLDRAEILAASLKERIAEITVKFISEIVSVTKNADGAVVEGDPTSVRRITDIWTFARDTASSDPNWKLIGTTVGH